MILILAADNCLFAGSFTCLIEKMQCLRDVKTKKSFETPDDNVGLGRVKADVWLTRRKTTPLLQE